MLLDPSKYGQRDAESVEGRILFSVWYDLEPATVSHEIDHQRVGCQAIPDVEADQFWICGGLAEPVRH